MRFTSWKAFVALAVSFAPVAYGAQCQRTLDIAKGLAHRLQQQYFEPGPGTYRDGWIWTDANTLEDLHNLMLATGSNEWAAVADQSFIGRSANNPNANWHAILNGSNDDSEWVILALWKMADYRAARGQSNANFLRASRHIYDIILLNGIIIVEEEVLWWSTAKTYKNAITNELWLYISAEAFLRFRENRYIDNAKRTWEWLRHSGMRNEAGLWNDGLHECRNNGQTTWTYNQGVIAAGLASLYSATGETWLLDEAEITIDATIRRLTHNNILRESCDDARPTAHPCNKDQQLFKGLWVKHLQYYLDRANSPARSEKYKWFIGAQSSAVIHYGTSASNDVGSVWYSPNEGGSIFSAKSSTAGLEVQIATAKYGPC